MLDALRQLFRDHPIAAPAGTAVALLGAERLLRPAGCGSGTPGLLLTAGGVVAAGVAGIRLGAMAAGVVADSPGEMLRSNPTKGRAQLGLGIDAAPRASTIEIGTPVKMREGRRVLQGSVTEVRNDGRIRVAWSDGSWDSYPRPPTDIQVVRSNPDARGRRWTMFDAEAFHRESAQLIARRGELYRLRETGMARPGDNAKVDALTREIDHLQEMAREAEHEASPPAPRSGPPTYWSEHLGKRVTVPARENPAGLNDGAILLGGVAIAGGAAYLATRGASAATQPPTVVTMPPLPRPAPVPTPPAPTPPAPIPAPPTPTTPGPMTLAERAFSDALLRSVAAQELFYFQATAYSYGLTNDPPTGRTSPAFSDLVRRVEAAAGVDVTGAFGPELIPYLSRQIGVGYGGVRRTAQRTIPQRLWQQTISAINQTAAARDPNYYPLQAWPAT